MKDMMETLYTWAVPIAFLGLGLDLLVNTVPFLAFLGGSFLSMIYAWAPVAAGIIGIWKAFNKTF